MEVIYPSDSAIGLLRSNFVLTASVTQIIVPALSNTRGITVLSTSYRWNFGVINSQVSAHILTASDQFHSILDDNGPAGPINMPQGALFENPIHITPGRIFRLDALIVGTARLSVSVVYRQG